MKRLVIDAAFGLVVAASLAVATPASATRWYNKGSPPNQPLYLSVAGGPQCTPNHRICWLPQGAAVILWGYGTLDQEWFTEVVTQQGRSLRNSYDDEYQYSLYLSVGAGSKDNGANLVVWEAGAYPYLTQDQDWWLIKAEDWGAPFPGCYVFYNTNSDKVMGAGSVVQGAQVIQWDLIGGVPGTEYGWHKDQFWCPG